MLEVVAEVLMKASVDITTASHVHVSHRPIRQTSVAGFNASVFDDLVVYHEAGHKLDVRLAGQPCSKCRKERFGS